MPLPPSLPPSPSSQDLLAVFDTDVINILGCLDNDNFVRAAARNDTQLLSESIANGQSVHVKHSLLLYTPLHAAADFGQMRSLTVLIGAGAALDSQMAPCGKTPLHYAAEHGRYDVVNELLAAGAAKNINDSDQRRPWEVSRALLCLINMRPTFVFFANIADPTASVLPGRSQVRAFSGYPQG